MPDIREARAKIMEFFQMELGMEPEALQVIKVGKSDNGWVGTVQVTELNEYLKKMGYPPIFDKNHYKIALDENLNVVRYARKDEEDEEEG